MEVETRISLKLPAYFLNYSHHIFEFLANSFLRYDFFNRNSSDGNQRHLRLATINRDNQSVSVKTTNFSPSVNVSIDSFLPPNMPFNNNVYNAYSTMGTFLYGSMHKVHKIIFHEIQTKIFPELLATFLQSMSHSTFFTCKMLLNCLIKCSTSWIGHLVRVNCQYLPSCMNRQDDQIPFFSESPPRCLLSWFKSTNCNLENFVQRFCSLKNPHRKLYGPIGPKCGIGQNFAEKQTCLSQKQMPAILPVMYQLTFSKFCKNIPICYFFAFGSAQSKIGRRKVPKSGFSYKLSWWPVSVLLKTTGLVSLMQVSINIFEVVTYQSEIIVW